MTRLLAWRWTPFFALLSLALLACVITALSVPSKPLELFKTAEASTSATLTMGTGSNIAARTSSTQRRETSSSNTPSALATTRTASNPSRARPRGSLDRLVAKNQAESEQRAQEQEASSISVPAPNAISAYRAPALIEDPEEAEEEVIEEEEVVEEEVVEEPSGQGGAAAEGADSQADESVEQQPIEEVPGPPTSRFINPNLMRTFPRQNNQ